MYKELVSSIESNLKRFAEVPELEEVTVDSVYDDEDMDYEIIRHGGLRLEVKIGNSLYVFRDKDWEAILARLTELWVNE